jgi:EAL domain-containing protein (putative c-di-GMP-specific phosphodiesterase class I)
MRNADLAMYRAKNLGRGRAVFFEPRVKMLPRLKSPIDLRAAWERHELSLSYQPQFTVSDGTLAGLEALLGWETARDGVLSAGEFVPAAEESGLIVGIGWWTLAVAGAQLARWRAQCIAPPRLTLTLSAQQLKQPHFSKFVQHALDKYGVPSRLLDVELTGSVLADEAARAAIVGMAQMGLHLTLVHFGTGCSLPAHVRAYPVGTVKIDKTLLEGVPQCAASTTLVEAIISMGHALGKRVVAEGIETPEQLQALRERGCDVAQGFLLGKPLSSRAATELLRVCRVVREPGVEIAAVG